MVLMFLKIIARSLVQSLRYRPAKKRRCSTEISERGGVDNARVPSLWQHGFLAERKSTDTHCL